MTCFQLDELANKLRGVPPAPNNPNLYFVRVSGTVMLATTSFPIALTTYEHALRSGKNCDLSDRRQGLVAWYDAKSGQAYDDTGLDYYQQQKWGWTDEQFAELKASAKKRADDHKAFMAAQVQALSRPGQWLVLSGKYINSYFYVRAILPNGELRGYQIHHKHKGRAVKPIVRVGCASIDSENILKWHVASMREVNRLRLGDYL
jgi:hypothetical protein